MPAKIPNLGKLDSLTLLAVYQDARSRLIPKVTEMLAQLAEETRALETLQEELGAQQVYDQPQTSQSVAGGQRPHRSVMASPPSARGGRKIEPKYRNPGNPSETWAGRGLPQRWLVACERAGRKREEFLVSATAGAAGADARPSTADAPSSIAVGPPSINAPISVQQPMSLNPPVQAKQ